MRAKMRFTLPLVQVAIAIGVIAGNLLRNQWGSRPAFNAPEIQFCYSLNAPATRIWDWLLRVKGRWWWAPQLMEAIVDRLPFVVFVGLLWYLVSIEMGGSGQSVLTPKTKIRSAADVLMIAYAGWVAAFGITIRSNQFGSVTTYSTLVATPYFLWALAIAAFYGHDLWVCLRTRRATLKDRTSGNGSV